MILFSQYVTSLSNASVPYLPFGWIPKTTGSLQKSPDPECSFLQWTCSTPWTIPLFCQFKCNLPWAKGIKAVTLLKLKLTESKRHHCSSKGYTKECTCTAQYDVSPTSMSSSTDWETIQPHMVQQQYCQNLGFPPLRVSLNCFYYLWFLNFVDLS